MSLRWLLPSLVLLLSVPALAEDGVTVRVRCTEKCTVVLGGKQGRRVDDVTWEFQGVAPGQRRLEVTGLLGRPLVSSFAEIPDVAEASIILTANKRIVVEQGSTVTPGTPAWADPKGAKPVAGGSREKSVAVVHCTEECTVLLDGRSGVRRDKWTWEFRDVEPGRRRVEATGLIDRPLFLDYVDMPAGSEVKLYGDSKGKVTLTDRKELRAAGTKSRLNVRCQKPCTVTLDGTRRGTSDASIVVLEDVKPGPHELQVDFPVGKRMRRTTLQVSAGSEVFITASEGSGFQVTNTKPLGRP